MCVCVFVCPCGKGCIRRVKSYEYPTSFDTVGVKKKEWEILHLKTENPVKNPKDFLLGSRAKMWKNVEGTSHDNSTSLGTVGSNR